MTVPVPTPAETPEPEVTEPALCDDKECQHFQHCRAEAVGTPEACIRSQRPSAMTPSGGLKSETCAQRGCVPDCLPECRELHAEIAAKDAAKAASAPSGGPDALAEANCIDCHGRGWVDSTLSPTGAEGCESCDGTGKETNRRGRAPAPSPAPGPAGEPLYSEDTLRAALDLALEATPWAMGGSPDLLAPNCPTHDRCPDPWDCYEQRVRHFPAIAAARGGAGNALAEREAGRKGATDEIVRYLQGLALVTQLREILDAADAIEDGEHLSQRPSPERDDTAAKTLYDSWSDQPGWVPWVPHGNSDMQDKARRLSQRPSGGEGA